MSFLGTCSHMAAVSFIYRNSIQKHLRGLFELGNVCRCEGVPASPGQFSWPTWLGSKSEMHFLKALALISTVNGLSVFGFPFLEDPLTSSDNVMHELCSELEALMARKQCRSFPYPILPGSFVLLPAPQRWRSLICSLIQKMWEFLIYILANTHNCFILIYRHLWNDNRFFKQKLQISLY